MNRFGVLIILLNFFAISSVLSLKNGQFCDKDDKTGLCQEHQEYDDDDGDEPCWYEDPDISGMENGKEELKQKEFGKLYMIDGVKVLQRISNLSFKYERCCGMTIY